MMIIKKDKIELNDSNLTWYNRKGYHMTGETITITTANPCHGLEESTTYVVFKGTWTRSGTIRDCGDHYIYAGYSSYTRIEKDTLEITEDVEDR